MDKKSKILLIITIIIAILAIVGIMGYFMIKNKNTESIEEVSKLNQYYQKLQNTEMYSFEILLDAENSIHYEKNKNQAFYTSTYEGKTSKYLIKDGNTYLLRDNDKVYYTYTNNETELYKIELQISQIKDKPVTFGKEKINKKQYKYEEFEGLSEFYFGTTTSTDEENIKTRFYFDGNDLKYIKTINGENEQLVTINYKEEIDSNSFVIPEDYKEM